MKINFKLSLIPILFIFPIFLTGQTFTINSVATDMIFIGFDNYLKIEGFSKDESISIKTPQNITHKKHGTHLFNLKINRIAKDIPIILFKEEIAIDTIFLSSYRSKVDQFVNASNFGFIQSGAYPLDVLKQIKSLEIICNIPSEKVNVQGFRIEIYKGEKIISSETIKGKNLVSKEVTHSIDKLKKGDFILISKVRAVFPWSCGNKPHGFKLVVK